MKLGYLILLLICAMVTAVPRMKRSEVATVEGSTVEPAKADADKTKESRICAPTTPCGWSIYNPVNKRVEINIKNTYCICSLDKFCEVYEDDTSTSTLVHRCMKPES